MHVLSTAVLGLAAARGVLAAPTCDDHDVFKCLAANGVPVDTPGSDDYIRDSAPFNLRLPWAPVGVAVPTTVPQIQKAVNCCRQAGVKCSAKSGGHSYASFGLGGENGHLVIELDRMYNVTYDAATNVATAQPGIRLGHLATVLNNQYGRAISHGTCPGVGIGGHFGHGGFGFSSHKHGLALDSIVGVDVVLADGSLVHASDTQNSDLFWAVKGAASNFGIVVSWQLSTFPAPTTLTYFGVTLNWNKNTAVAGLEALENYVTNTMPAELNFRVSDYSAGNPGIEGLYYGTEAEMRAAIAPLLKAAAPNAVINSPTTVSWLNAVLHYSFFPDIDWIKPSPQEKFYSKSLTLKGLHGTSAQNFVNYWFTNMTQLTSRGWWFQLDMQGGKYSAVTTVGQDATSYAHRDKLYMVQFYDKTMANTDPYPSDGFKYLDGWVAATTAPLQLSDWGMYINYADPRLSRDAALRAYYMDHLPKLKTLKAKYDPKELFYNPLGIPPA